MLKTTTGVAFKNAGTESKQRPKLTIPQQIAYMRDKKGIKFSIVTEDDAERFLSSSNYYFKVKAFEKNYTCCVGENAGKYFDLEFAYLQELSTLDMYLREMVMAITLDIEHYLKLQLLKDISSNEKEDGYAIVNKFLEMQPRIRDSINEKASNSYCENLVRKYKDNFAAWNIVEVLSFGHLIEFCDLYYSLYPNEKITIGNYRIVKFLRNAAAHNNCLINDLSNNEGDSFKQSREANSFVASIKGISTKTRVKKMGNRFVHDFVVMLCCFNEIVSSDGVKKHQIQRLKKLIDERFPLHGDYFKNNLLIRSNYEFVKKIVDKVAEMCI